MERVTGAALVDQRQVATDSGSRSSASRVLRRVRFPTAERRDTVVEPPLLFTSWHAPLQCSATDPGGSEQPKFRQIGFDAERRAASITQKVATDRLLPAPIKHVVAATPNRPMLSVDLAKALKLGMFGRATDDAVGGVQRNFAVLFLRSST